MFLSCDLLYEFDLRFNLTSAIHLQAGSTIFISVKTTPKFYKCRLKVLKATWLQKVERDKVG